MNLELRKQKRSETYTPINEYDDFGIIGIQPGRDE